MTSIRRPVRAALAAALAATVAAGTALAAPTAAKAADATIGVHQNASYPTWFFGRTTLCFQSLSSAPGLFFWAADGIVGASSVGLVDVPAGSSSCVTRSWLGFRVDVTNISSDPSATARVYNLGGPR